MKVCKDCGDLKPLSEYYAHLRMADGHLNSCKDCKRAYQRSRPYDKEYQRRRNQTKARKEFLAANLKRWRRANPEKVAMQLARRRARELGAEGSFTVEEFAALCARYGNVCLRCGDEEASLTPDHVVPLALGGVNSIENIQPLCRACNCWKNINTVDYRSDRLRPSPDRVEEAAALYAA